MRRPPSTESHELQVKEGHQDPAGTSPFIAIDLVALVRHDREPKPAVGCGRDEALGDCLLSVGILGKRTKADWARQAGGVGRSHPSAWRTNSPGKSGAKTTVMGRTKDHGDHGDFPSSAPPSMRSWRAASRTSAAWERRTRPVVCRARGPMIAPAQAGDVDGTDSLPIRSSAVDRTKAERMPVRSAAQLRSTRSPLAQRDVMRSMAGTDPTGLTARASSSTTSGSCASIRDSRFATARLEPLIAAAAGHCA